MHAWFRSPRVRRFGSILFLLLTPLACSSWQATNAPIPESLAARPNARYRVTFAAGNQVELKAVSVVGDSLIGIVARDPVPGMERFAVAVTEVEQIEVRRTDTGVTSLLVFGVAAVVAVAVVLWVEMSNIYP